MARLPIPGGDDGNWGQVLNDFLDVSHASDGTLKSSAVTNAGAASDSAVVHNTGAEAVAGTKTFNASPVVPTPTLGSQAANKTYVDSVAGAGAPDATASTKGILQLAGDLGGTATAPTVPGLASKQPLDSDLTDIAALTPANDDVLQRKAGAWTNRTPAQLKTDLALTKSDVGLGNVPNVDATNRANHTGTQTASTISDFTEAAQDAVGGALTDTNTIDLTYNDAGNAITADARTQMSITSDSSGLKLSGDATTPGTSRYYGTDGSGTKGYFAIPAGGESNTASNIGAGGVGVFKQKSGVDLQFKNINAGSNKVTITDDTTNSEVDIDVVPANFTGIPESAVTNLTSDLASKVSVSNGGGETFSDAGNSGTAITLNLANGNVQKLTLTGNCTITLTSPASGAMRSLTLLVFQDATGSRTITWPGSVKWGNAGAPTLTTTASKMDMISLFTVDGGTNWYGALGAKGF